MSKICIGMPIYDGKVFADCVTSIVSNCLYLIPRGHTVALNTLTGCCYLDRARNEVVDKFLKSDYEWLIFVDADLAFEQRAIDKLMSIKKDLVFAAYPMKGQQRWTIRPVGDKDGMVTIKTDGTMLCEIAPTGLMKIHRRVFENMQRKHPEWLLPGDPFPFFATGKITRENEWEGEDVVFCRRYIADGGECWCYTDIDVDHIGVQHNKGNFNKFSKGLE